MLVKNTYNLIFLFAILITGLSCAPAVEQSGEEDDLLLAEVFKKKLFASEIADMVPPSSSSADSALIANAIVDQWVRDNIMMHEAEKNIPQDLNIDELVRDYRASLVKHNYEKLIIELQLDSVITQQELKEYYSEHVDDYVLESTIVRCNMIKINKDTERLNDLRNWWENKNEENFSSMLDYARTNAEIYMLNDSTWYKLEDVIDQLPKGMVTESNVLRRKNINIRRGDSHYFFRLNDIVKQKEVAPLSYIKDQLSNVILHQRKIKLLEEQKQQMYDRELRRNNITIYTN